MFSSRVPGPDPLRWSTELRLLWNFARDHDLLCSLTLDETPGATRGDHDDKCQRWAPTMSETLEQKPLNFVLNVVESTISASEYALPSHLIRITQGSILGLLGVPARRRDDVGSRPTAAGGLAMYTVK